MILRFHVPARFFLHARRAEDLNRAGEFDSDGLRIRLEISGPDPLQDKTATSPQFFVLCQAVGLDVHDDDGGTLAALVHKNDWAALARHLTMVANRVLRGIRHVGRVSTVSEVSSTAFDPETRLREWGVTVGDTEADRRPLFEERDPRLTFGAILTGLVPGARSPQDLSAAMWPDIIETIREDRKPTPSEDFVVNAIEHVMLGNYRYAVLEAVIGLEIALTRYFRLYLEQRGLSNTAIKEFLSPQLPLRDRIAVLLDLTMERGTLRDYDMGKIRGVITWRNEIVHQYGHLRPEIPPETIREGIAEVVALTVFMDLKHAELLAAPQLQKVAHDIRSEIPPGLGGALVSLRSLPRHRIVVDFTYITGAPDEAEMRRLVDIVTTKITPVDTGFVRDRHLSVTFQAWSTPEIYGRWRNGVLTLASGQMPEGVKGSETDAGGAATPST